MAPICPGYFYLSGQAQPERVLSLTMAFSSFLLAGLGALLLAAPARAQVPPALPGRWEARSIGFATTSAMPDSVRDHLDDPQVADLNQAIADGEAQLLVDFHPDGTYHFTIVRDGQLLRDEAGTYSLTDTLLLAQSPGSPDGSSFHEQQVRQLTRRLLVLAFPAGPALPGVEEEVEYRRVGRQD